MMSIAFYRARWDGRLWDNAVSMFSGFGPFAHVELVFSDGLSFSSTSMDDQPGPRFKKIEYDPIKWVVSDLPYVTDHDEARMRSWAWQQIVLADGYDWGAIWRFVPGIGRLFKPSDSKWMCSEIVVSCLRYAGYFQDDRPAHRISPNRLAKMMGVQP
jgi:hypothetical protein